MTWTHYRLRFRLLSPLHVGYRKVGNLMQTRPYVPGKVLWGALTARITRDDHDGSQGTKYRDIGELVQEHFRFGYLWPSVDGNEPCFPWEHEDFDYLLLGSYASTALNYDQQAADEGTLHETEFIAPVARHGQPVYLVGDLWVREGNLPQDLDGWQEAFQKLQLGGERTYGWGRVRCYTDWQSGESGQGTAMVRHGWQEQNGEVVLTIEERKKLTAHARAAEEGAISGVVGPVEPLVGWERDNEDSDKTWRLSTAVICWAPGSQATQEIEVRMTSYGIWEAM